MERKATIAAIALALAALFPALGRQSAAAPPGEAVSLHPVGPLEPVGPIRQRPEWNRFVILVWQYQTDARRDRPLYEKIGLHGFHIDHGAGKQALARWSLEAGFPYYVGHAAGKGILYLYRRERPAILRKRTVVRRPHSLADPATMAELERRLRRNVRATSAGLVLGYAFDDEISLGTFNSPCEVDAHPQSVAWYRRWLAARYGTIERLNRQWGSTFKSFGDVAPASFESVRRQLDTRPPSAWNLSPWVDFRHFMDYQFATVLRRLAEFTNRLDPRIPAGFVGGQQPSAYGGYDYAYLARAVQWMEAYDIGGTNEILRSLWNNPRRPHVQTFFSKGDPRRDSWFLWYYAVHGNQAVIAWPEKWFRRNGYDIRPSIAADAETFREVQSAATAPFVSPDTRFDPDPIGVYYSHPSVQVGWAIDCIPHRSTWINRLSALDNNCQTQGHLRVAWFKLLEDCGFQYDVIPYLDVQEGRADLGRFKAIILPRTIALSDAEAAALRRFVESGGTLIADAMCGLTDEHGRGRPRGALDDLFGIERDEHAGFFNGKELAEINGELYARPFLERLTAYRGALRWRNIVVVERATHPTDSKCENLQGTRTAVMFTKKVGRGRAVYLNLSPLEYLDASRRTNSYGATWRAIARRLLAEAGLRPRLVIRENGREARMIEALWWRRRDGMRYLAVVKNPVRRATVSSFGKIEGASFAPEKIALEFREPVRDLVNLRTGKHLGSGAKFTDTFNPCEANVYEVK